MYCTRFVKWHRSCADALVILAFWSGSRLCLRLDVEVSSGRAQRLATVETFHPEIGQAQILAFFPLVVLLASSTRPRT